MSSTEHKDCFGLMRLLAAVWITYVHATILLQINIPYPVNEILWLPSVQFFFCLSGFLIWPSVGRSTSFGNYCKKRFWRIYPELWVSVFLSAICILIFIQRDIGWGQFILFFISQLTVPNMWIPDFLSGLGSGKPNAPLWYVRVILQFYIIAYILFKCINKRRAVQILLFVLSLLVAYFHEKICLHVPQKMAVLYGKTLIQYMWLFLWGIIISENKDFFIRYAKKYWILFAIIAYALVKSNNDIFLSEYNYGLFASVLSFVAILGFAYKFPQLDVKTDISYAIYIYHMIVVFAFIQLGFKSSLLYLVLVFAFTIPLSFISTKTIGSIGLRKKQNLR